MKVALVICPQANADKPPLSLAYLGAYLLKKGITVTCFDFNIDLYARSDSEKKELWSSVFDREWMDEKQGMSLVSEEVLDSWEKEIINYAPDVVGFSLLSTNLFSSFRLAQKIKSAQKEIKIIFGGPEVYRAYGSGNGEALSIADVLICGEGEEKLFWVVDTLTKQGKICPADGVIVRDEGGWIGSDVFYPSTAIDNFPFPYYGWFALAKYKEKGYQLPLIFSRGCIGRCEFCFEKAYWKNYRSRSVGNVIAEIKEIKSIYGVRAFCLNDSLMNGNIQFLSEFCEKVISERIEINWWGMARINSLMTERFVAKMVQAGCKNISYGIESGSQKVLNLMHKDYTIPQIEEVIQDTCRAGIKPGINILLGFPGEGNYEFNETCGFVKRNSRFISYVNVSTLGIEPYTGIYLNIENYGIKMKGSTDWLSRDGTNNFQIRNQRAAILNGIIRQYVNR